MVELASACRERFKPCVERGPLAIVQGDSPVRPLPGPRDPCRLSSMLNLIKGFVLGFLAGCLTLLGCAYTHHIVRTAEGFKVVSKSPGSLDKIYVDTRSWGAVDYISNRDVVQALARAGYEQSRQQAEQSLKNSRDTIEKALLDAQREMEAKLKSVR